MSSLNCFGATDDILQNLEVEGDERIWGNLDVDGTVTASQFAGGTITPSFYYQMEVPVVQLWLINHQPIVDCFGILLELLLVKLGPLMEPKE